MTFRKFIFLLKLLAKRDFEPSTTDGYKSPANVHEIALPVFSRLAIRWARWWRNFFGCLLVDPQVQAS